MPQQANHEPTLQSLEEENKRLKHAVEELSVLNDLARAIGASLNTQEIIQTYHDYCTDCTDEQIAARRGH